MNKKTVSGAIVAAVAIFIISAASGSFENAQAEGRAVASEPEIGTILDSMQPGAVVDREPDGSLSFNGMLTPTANAEVRAAIALEEAGARVVQCVASRAATTCTKMEDRDVEPALRRGETVYHRAYYRGISNETITKQIPLFEEAELVCNEASDDSLRCTRVDTVAPAIAANATIFITYRPFHVKFSANGTMTTFLGDPVVPLERG